MLDVLSLSLSMQGFEVVKAVNGIDALAQYRAKGGDFFAIITDHDMPQLNGLGFVRQIRAEGYTGRIVLMSGRLMPSDFHEFTEFDITRFLQKPFVVDVLTKVLREATPVVESMV